MKVVNLSLCCLWPFHPSLCHCLKAMLLVGIFPSQGLTTHNSFFTPCPEWLMPRWNDRMGAKMKTLKKFPTDSHKTQNPPKKSHGGFLSLKNFQKALNHITRKIPKKILAKFSYPKKSWNRNFQTPKNPSIIPGLEIWSTPLRTNINNYSFLNNIHIHQENNNVLGVEKLPWSFIKLSQLIL